MIPQNEFDVYDMGLAGLRDKYLLEISQFMTEQLLTEEQQQTSVADNTWYIKWRGEAVALVKNNFAQFKNYAQIQIQKYNTWLKDNRQYFDINKYPVDSACRLNRAPNYKAALLRLKEPITSAMNGIDLKRIQVPDANANGSQAQGNGRTTADPSANNVWFMKFMIKSYNGDGSDFTKYAKNYYYGGEGQKRNMNENQIASMMSIMYNYCFNYAQTVTNLENQLNSLVMFINKDPVSGQQQSSASAQTEYQNLQRAQGGTTNTVASTNPQNNAQYPQTVQHASAHMNRGWLLEYNMAATMPTASASGNTATASSATGTISQSVNGQTVNQSNPQQQTKQTNDPNGTPKVQINEKLLSMKKKQIACDLLKDCFQAKVTASGMIYRDFIVMLQTHVGVILENRIRKQQK